MKFIQELIAKKRNEHDDVEITENLQTEAPEIDHTPDGISDQEIISNLSAISAKSLGQPVPSDVSSSDSAESEPHVSRIPDFADVVDGRRAKKAADSENSNLGDDDFDDDEFMELDDDELWDEIDDLEDYDDPDDAENQKATAPSPVAARKPVVTKPSTPPVAAANVSEIRSIPRPVPRPAMAEKAVTQPLSNPSKATPEVSTNTAPASQGISSTAPEHPTPQVKKIWDLEPGPAEGSHLQPVKDLQPTSPQPTSAPKNAEAPKPAEGRVPARAGRVKTRLLGFEHAQDSASDPFQASSTTAKSTAITFPVGWMVVTKGPGRGNSFSLFNGVSQIGRGDDQAIRLDFGDNSISRSNHAAVAYDAEQRAFYLGHGGKANLVRLNDKPVLSTEELSNRDQIRIGETTLRFVAFCGDEFDWDLDNQDETHNAAIA